MNKLKRILKVPQESFLRNKLRKETRLLVEKAGLLPPAPFKVMEQMAIDLLKELDISEEYIDFTIVLIGNESWRPTVEATPFHRRLLLLPQCLKDNTKCKGVFDELGLNCAGCKACPIDNILIEAETLGYTTLVAEGTTVAIGLVEEGAIDAVIGVSCMPVLQRSFEPVSNAAVPVIGLPLMYDGCQNTQVDLKWLYDEIREYKSNSNKEPVSVSGLKLGLDEFFSNGSMENYFSQNDKTESLAKEFLQIGGQRMRPMLATLAYQSYTDDVKDEISYPLSLIIECFHKASLIHDDIEDNADLRYDVPTAHKKYGIPLAINTGDYLIGKGYKLISELPVDGIKIAKVLKQVSQSHLKLTLGQGADILLYSNEAKPIVESTLQVFKQKTGEAIKVALLSGAILGDAENRELEILEQFSDLFGISYQIRDDLNEFAEENDHEKIADFPFLVALANEKLPDVPVSDVVAFRRLIVENELDKTAQIYLNEYTQKCYAELDKLNNSKLRLSLYGVLGKVFKSASVDV